MLKLIFLHKRGELEKAIDITLKAKAIKPEEEFIFLILADDYIKLKRYDEAEVVLQEALKLFPINGQLNIMYAQILAERQAPLKTTIPYFKAYLKTVPKGYYKLPEFVKTILKPFDKKGKLIKIEESYSRNDIELEAWAQENIDLFEKDSK